MDFTIVTPSHRQLDWLACCIASVADQEGVTVEHIVQDAGTEGFAEFAERMRKRWPDREGYRRVMISEPDGGMYDAINKGLKRGSGRICAYLNCDEQYLPGALVKVKEGFAKHSEAEILYGGFLVVDERGELVTAQRPVRMFWQHVATSHLPNFTCATFFQRSMLERDQAWFDSSLRFCGDIDWTILRLKKETPVELLPFFTSTFLQHSKNSGLSAAGLREAEKIRRMYLAWNRNYRWLWILIHRLKKLVTGGYRKEKVSVWIYKTAGETHRLPVSGRATPIWWTRWVKATAEVLGKSAADSGSRGYSYPAVTRLLARVLERILPCPRPGSWGKPTQDAPVILLIELFGLGDVASLSVMLDPIRYRYPHAKIYIACQESWQDFYQKDPRVAGVYGLPTPWKAKGDRFFSADLWRRAICAIHRLRALQIDWCFDTRGDLRSQLFARWCLPARLVAPADYLGSNLNLRGRLCTDSLGILPRHHRYQRNCDCLRPLLGQAPRFSLPSLPAPLRKNKKTKPSLLLHTAGGWKYRWWPQDRWRALIKKLQSDDNWKVGVLVGPGDEESVSQITRDLEVVVEKPRLRDLLKLIQGYDVFVGTDSGPLHLAVLSGIQVVDLMGPGDPVLWAPPPGTGILLQDVRDYDCHPCIQKKCFYPKNPCIEKIALSQVLAAIDLYQKKLKSGNSAAV